MQVVLAVDALPADQNITAYKWFQDDLEVGQSPNPEFTIADTPVGIHKYEVCGVSLYGDTPKSDPVFTPSIGTKPENLRVVNIVINM